MDKKFSIGISTIALIIFSINSAYATNHETSIFSDAVKYANSNSYKNEKYNFSIEPPLNWGVLNNLPANVSSNAIVVFSNSDHNHLATFGIHHRAITQNVINLLNNHPDKDILATIAQEMSSKDPNYQTVVYNGVVDRYTDGIKVTVNSATQYNIDNFTTISENVIYFIYTGDQYNLDLTSNSNDFDKNSKMFEDSVNSFLVSQTTPVPEFPIHLIILIIAMFSVIFITRIKKVK